MPSLATAQKVVVNPGLAKSVFGSKMVEHTVIYSVCILVLIDILIDKEVVDIIGQIKVQKWTWPRRSACHPRTKMR